MDLAPSVLNAAVMTLVGVFITWLTRTQLRDLRKDLKDDIAGLKRELRDFRTEIRTELRSEIASVRSDLTQVALAVGARQQPQTG